MFDWWGNCVFIAENTSPNDINTQWDRIFSNTPASRGVYTYVGKITLSDGKEQIIQGSFTLLR